MPIDTTVQPQQALQMPLTPDGQPKPEVAQPASQPSASDALEQLILKAASLDKTQVAELPLEQRVSAAGLTWEQGKPKSNDPTLVIFAMFTGSDGDDRQDHMPGDVRIYAAPTAAGTPFTRFTCNRATGAGFVGTVMAPATFVRKVGFELQRLAVAEGVLQDCTNEECEETYSTDLSICPECFTEFGDDGEVPEDTTAPEDEVPSVVGSPLRSV